MDAHIQNEYLNPKTGFSSVATMAKRLGLSPDDVRAALEKLPTYQRTFPSRYREETHFRITAPAGSYQIDLVFMPGSHQNKGYVGFLLCVEVTTRKMHAYPIKGKTIGYIKPVLETFVQEVKPVTISSDNESTFMSASVQQLFASANIEHRAYRPDDHRAMGILDRAVRTLKDMLQRYFLANETIKWLKVLPEIVENYNTRPHRSLDGRSPDDVAEDKDFQDELRGDAIEHNLKALAKTATFAKGDKVRIYEALGTTEKGRPKYSDEVYTVEALEGLSYRLRNANGNLLRHKFRPYELVGATQGGTDVIREERVRARVKRKIAQDIGDTTGSIQPRDKRMTALNAKAINAALLEDNVVLPKKDFVKEHTGLIDLLKNGSRQQQRKEADDQARELAQHISDFERFISMTT